jgi:hypothetical protein
LLKSASRPDGTRRFAVEKNVEKNLVSNREETGEKFSTAFHRAEEQFSTQNVQNLMTAN